LDNLFDSIKAGNFQTNPVETRESNPFVLPRHSTFGEPSKSGSGEGETGEQLLATSSEVAEKNN
jgi:hypothetical protein